MANLRYLALIVLVVAIAAGAVLWQGRDDNQPKITFTKPEHPLDERDAEASESDPSFILGSATTSIVPREEPLETTGESAVSAGIADQRIAEEELTDEQLAAQIEIAQRRLARVEALNAQKQALFEREIAQTDSAEQPLIEAEIAYRIGGWRQAWRTGNVRAYFDFYSKEFRPSNGKSMEQWKAQRVERLNPEKPIDLNLEDFDVEFDEATQRSLITFTQHYKSGDYEDVAKKRLVMANEQGQWMILSETTQ